jgi:hypothetical protein
MPWLVRACSSATVWLADLNSLACGAVSGAVMHSFWDQSVVPLARRLRGLRRNAFAADQAGGGARRSQAADVS